MPQLLARCRMTHPLGRRRRPRYLGQDQWQVNHQSTTTCSEESRPKFTVHIEGSTQRKVQQELRANPMQMHRATKEQLQRRVKIDPRSLSNRRVSPPQDQPKYHATHSRQGRQDKGDNDDGRTLKKGTSNTEEVARSPFSINALSNTCHTSDR